LISGTKLVLYSFSLKVLKRIFDLFYEKNPDSFQTGLPKECLCLHANHEVVP